MMVPLVCIGIAQSRYGLDAAAAELTGRTPSQPSPAARERDAMGLTSRIGHCIPFK